MSESFLGIDNRNEFFTQHYLAAILAGDLKPLLQGWRERAAEARAAEADTGATSGATIDRLRTPPQALGACHLGYFRYRERARRLREPDARVRAHQQALGAILDALGYRGPGRIVELPAGHVPLMARVTRSDGAPLLWCLPVVGTHDDERPTLARPVLPAQLSSSLVDQMADASPDDDRPAADDLRCPPEGTTVEDLVTEAFSRDEPPRFVLVCGETDLFLLERGKWAEQRLLRFDLEEILGRRDPATLDVSAAILHRECLAPRTADGNDGAALLDTLDDNSHKHAFEVSEDLKYALQACIERLALLCQNRSRFTQDSKYVQFLRVMRQDRKKLHFEDSV